MPAPMMAPIPIAVMLTGPSVLESWWPLALLLSMIAATDFRAMTP